MRTFCASRSLGSGHMFIKGNTRGRCRFEFHMAVFAFRHRQGHSCSKGKARGRCRFEFHMGIQWQDLQFQLQQGQRGGACLSAVSPTSRC